MKTYDNQLSQYHFMHGRTIIPEMLMSTEGDVGTPNAMDYDEGGSTEPEISEDDKNTQPTVDDGSTLEKEL